jgi:cytoskeletal protein CcmA (bactofilin family)
MNDVETIVGQQTVIRGNLQGDEDLTVRGRVEGTIRLSRTLIVEPSGVVQADIDVKNAVISGVMVGNISASEFVQINEDGRMVGDIAAPRVIVVSGASFKGHIDMGDLEAPRGEGTSPAEIPAAARRTPPRPRPRETARPRPVATSRTERGAPARRAPATTQAARGEEGSERPTPPPAPKVPSGTAKKKTKKAAKKTTKKAAKKKKGSSKKTKGKKSRGKSSKKRKPPKPPSVTRGKKKKVKKKR